MSVSTILMASRGALARPRASVANMVVCATVAIVGAEVLVAAGLVVPGLVVDALLLIGLANAYAFRDGDVRGPRRNVLLALTLIPLLRLVVVTLDFPEVSAPYRIALAGTPLFLAVFLQARTIGIEALDGVIRLREDLLVGATGLPLGVIGYLILRPAPLVESPSVGELLVVSLILVVFTGLLEETIFRWLILRTLDTTFVRAGPLIASLLYAAAYLGTRSPGFVVFAGVAGLGACFAVRRSGSLLGVALAHGLASIGVLLVWPLVL